MVLPRGWWLGDSGEWCSGEVQWDTAKSVAGEWLKKWCPQPTRAACMTTRGGHDDVVRKEEAYE